MTKSAKCDCGCGQAPAATTRLRKVECPSCHGVARQSRTAIVESPLLCGREGCATAAYVPSCLYDADLVDMVADHPVYVAQRDAEVHRDLREHRAANPSIGIQDQWRCEFCAAIRKGDGSACAKCGETAPAIPGREFDRGDWDSPRRRRLRAERKKRGGDIGTRAPMRAPKRKNDDMPF